MYVNMSCIWQQVRRDDDDFSSERAAGPRQRLRRQLARIAAVVFRCLLLYFLAPISAFSRVIVAVQFRLCVRERG